MFEDDFPFYQRLPFDFMLSTAIFIIFAEIILFGFAILEMQGRIEFVRQLVMENISNFNSLNPSTILNDQDTKKILRHYIQSRLVMVLVLTTVVLSGLYFVLNRMIISPLRVILKKNRKTAEGDKLALIESDEIPNNEIGSIMRSRNEMLNTINTLYNEQALDTLREAVDAKDEYTEGHSRRVGEIASMLGEDLELPESDCEKLKHSGLLHDVGKIAVEDRILTKEGALTDSEFDEIMTHPVRGEKIIKFSRFSDSVLQGVRHHHEQFDGSGYPDGLSGLDIPLFGRILAVADAVDAMLSNRHYRDALSWVETRRELEENSGTQFDPKIAEAGIELLQPNNRDHLPEFN
jgi:HD-GYP domain-containing protein (c-di-GMP phosphodiesterase class II)